MTQSPDSGLRASLSPRPKNAVKRCPLLSSASKALLSITDTKRASSKIVSFLSISIPSSALRDQRAQQRHPLRGRPTNKGPPRRPPQRSGAPEWSRTITPLLAQEPESCVSTNFTTGAVKGRYVYPSAQNESTPETQKNAMPELRGSEILKVPSFTTHLLRSLEDTEADREKPA